MSFLWRIDVIGKSDRRDSAGEAAAHALRDQAGIVLTRCRVGRVYLIETSADRAAIQRIAAELLADPVTETAEILAEGAAPSDPAPTGFAVEVHLRAGVMDPVAASAMSAIRAMGECVDSLRTARRYVFEPLLPADQRRRVAGLLGNDCVERVVDGSEPTERPARPAARRSAPAEVQLRGLSDEALQALSRNGHLFLSPAEMAALQLHFAGLGREPTVIELETFAQTWSEHCVHKTLKSAIRYRGAPMPTLRSDGAQPAAGDTRGAPTEPAEVSYSNLLRDTIARATRELMAQQRGPECLSVFVDNAGVIGFDDDTGIAFKVETHNHPSAIEPYGGSATGVGGVIRDVLGCGLGAKPIANTDVFCVAPPDWPADAVPRGVIHPWRVLQGVVAGVRDYGNRMGIPTVAGAVHFDARYLGNPLVFCGCVGLIPRDRIEKAAQAGDLIVVLGGRTGRDGIHGATFSSAEMTDSHADEFSHAVQIGNAIEEKKVLDVLLLARDHADGCLYRSVTDCGAGGLSSAVGEMAAGLGAEVDLERVPLKYDGLRPDEIWISESQERMVLAVSPQRWEALAALCAAEDVEAAAIGRFTQGGRLVVRHGGAALADIDLQFLHDGLPGVVREAEWTPPPKPAKSAAGSGGQVSARDLLERLRHELARPTVASKEWIIRQYDHEVQGRSAIKSLVGPGLDGPGDAAVLRPRLNSRRGIALGCGLCPERSDRDPYWMAVAAIDEAIRNVVCVGGDPSQTAILDNFCWGRVDDRRQLGGLVRACQACHDAALEYGTPFISGKDSLNNEFLVHADDVRRLSDAAATVGCDAAELLRDGRVAIPGTLLISSLSLVPDVARCCTMDLKGSDTRLLLIGRSTPGDAFAVALAVRTHQLVHRLIAEGLVLAAHDVSDGGVLTAAAEMAIAGDVSLSLDLDLAAAWVDANSPAELLLDRSEAVYLVEVRGADAARVAAIANGVPISLLGQVRGKSDLEPAFELTWRGESALEVVANLRSTWKAPLAW